MDDKMEEVEIKQFIQAQIEQAKSKLPAKNLPILEEALNKVCLEGSSLKDALNIPQNLIDGYYERGYHFFNSGKFDEALPIFQFLSQLDNKEPRYILAIAATLHQMKNYDEAVVYYLLYGTLDLTNPMPYYHMYDCFSKLGSSDLGANALKAASQRAGQNPRYAELKTKLDLEIASFKS